MHRHADTVAVNFDPDNAGAEAAEKAVKLLLEEGLHNRVVTLDGGLDPDEYVKQKGVEAYRAKLDSASGYFHWLADRARLKFDMRSAWKNRRWRFTLVQKYRTTERRDCQRSGRISGVEPQRCRTNSGELQERMFRW